jgi:hypothetical protein
VRDNLTPGAGDLHADLQTYRFRATRQKRPMSPASSFGTARMIGSFA